MLRNALTNSLHQIGEILETIDNLPNAKATEFYCNTNAGKHVRLVLDHILAFIPSITSGTLDYNRRNRESDVETNWHAAKTQLHEILKSLETLPLENTPLEVISELDSIQTANQNFTSNVPREVLYLINHTIHHVAYIRLLAKGCGITLGDHIGIAPATATYIRSTGS
jgi:hypothetical protein